MEILGITYRNNVSEQEMYQELVVSQWFNLFVLCVLWSVPTRSKQSESNSKNEDVM